jgi:LmbE family N-acetylglucosaminyl deacetylase
VRRFLFGWLTILIGVLLVASCCKAQFPAAPGTGTGLPETIEAIDSARVTTRILYITAHPDDESAAVLTYLARGLHAEVALLSLTRGEGGQNALGPEQAPQLGLIRTQELLAAARGYGAKLYFTRARDFGFSKTPEETERVWGDQVLEDMVRVIREFRPNIVINGWGGVHSGHGHHQAAGILTPKAVQLASDTNTFPELLKEDLRPWAGSREKVQVLDLDRGSENPSGYLLPVDEVSPLYGKSYRQIGIDAFVNHRTQGISGFINSPFLRRPLTLKREDGKPFDSSTLAEPITRLFGEGNGEICKSHPDACEKLKEADGDLVKARAATLKLDFSSATTLIGKAQKSLDSLRPADTLSSIGPLGQAAETDIVCQSDRILKALLLASGFEFRTETERAEIVAGEVFTVSVTFQCRPEVNCPVQAPAELWVEGKQFPNTGDDARKGIKFSGSAETNHQELSIRQQLDAETRSVAIITLKDVVDPLHSHPVTLPVTHIEATSTSVVRVPLRIVPAYTLAVEPDQSVEVLNAARKPFDVLLRVHSYSAKPSKVSVGLDVPEGLTASAPLEVRFNGIGDQYAKITVTPPAKLAPGNFAITAYAKRGEEKFTTSLEPLPSMPTILWSEPAQCVVHAFDINVPPNLHVGYISA